MAEHRGWTCACFDIWDMFYTQIKESEVRIAFLFLKPKGLFVRLFLYS